MLAIDILVEETSLALSINSLWWDHGGSNQITKIYKIAYIPLLNESHPLDKLYVEKAHRVGHEGGMASLHRSCQEVWVIVHRRMAETI
jgi:hypothetical protein